MAKIEIQKITSGVFWVSIPAADVHILCGLPGDIIKHLFKLGIIKTVEKNNIKFETGPNTILLSDTPIQNGQFCNLGEFPVLQMLYRQGMIIPNHPNNTGKRPLIMGAEDQVKAQMEYIFRGNYGLVSEEEMIAAGATELEAKELMRLKLKFAFGKIRKSEEILDTLILKDNVEEIRNGAKIRRVEFNKYKISFQDESVEIDLALSDGEDYSPPYDLGFRNVDRQFFSVIQSGNGDGWSEFRPSMSSIIQIDGKFYLIDAGPNILVTLTALGIGINEIEGIFHTHAHDDHFAGLTTLIRVDHKIKYYATPLVRASVTKKLCALMSIREELFCELFEVHDLELDCWNKVNCIEVKPLISPHPIENTIFMLRALWEGGYRTYSHLADMVSLDVLEGMITKDDNAPGVSREFYNNVKYNYLTKSNVKKIDIGGGLIHGLSKDFSKDESEKIILAHFSTPLTTNDKEIGSDLPFGTEELLVPSNNRNYYLRYAFEYLTQHFYDTPRDQFKVLLNCTTEAFSAGSIIIKKGNITKYIYLILTGSVEVITSETSHNQLFSSGAILGELAGLGNFACMETYVAKSTLRALKIPCDLYHHFVSENNLYHEIEMSYDNINFLQNSYLFSEFLDYTKLYKLSKTMHFQTFPKDSDITLPRDGIFISKSGEVEIMGNGKCVEVIQNGDFFGECSIIQQLNKKMFTFKAKTDTTLYFIPKEELSDIPIVYWKLLEVFEKRAKC